MNKPKFKADDIKPFEWEELNGKTLRIVAGEQEGAMIVVGYDQETKDVYVLHEEFSKLPLPTIKPGDKVRHTMHGEGQVRLMEDSDAWVKFSWYQYDTLVPISELEVSHD